MQKEELTDEKAARNEALLLVRWPTLAIHHETVHLQSGLIAITLHNGHMPGVVVDACIRFNQRFFAIQTERVFEEAIGHGQRHEIVTVVRLALVLTVPDEQAAGLSGREQNGD